MQELYERAMRKGFRFQRHHGGAYGIEGLWQLEAGDLYEILDFHFSVSIKKKPVDSQSIEETHPFFLDKITILNHIIVVKLKEEAARAADNERALAIENIKQEPEKFREDVKAALKNLYKVFNHIQLNEQESADEGK